MRQCRHRRAACLAGLAALLFLVPGETRGRGAAAGDLTDDLTGVDALVRVYDSILDARPQVSQVALRECVSCFEEAKFSNHAVGRPTYEKMVHSLRVLQNAGA